MIVVIGMPGSCKSLYASRFYRDGYSVLDDCSRGVMTDAEVVVTQDPRVVSDLFPKEVHYVQRLSSLIPFSQRFRVRVFHLDQKIGVHVEVSSFKFKASDYLDIAATHHPEFIEMRSKGLL